MFIFRSSSLRMAWKMFKNIFTIKNIELLFNGKLFNIGFDYFDFNILVIGTIIILIVGILQEKGYNIREKKFLNKIYHLDGYYIIQLYLQ